MSCPLSPRVKNINPKIVYKKGKWAGGIIFVTQNSKF